MSKDSQYYLLQLMQLMQMLQTQVAYSCYTFKLNFSSGFCDIRNICDKCNNCDNRDKIERSDVRISNETLVVSFSILLLYKATLQILAQLQA
jgi:hypothetical protein